MTIVAAWVKFEPALPDPPKTSGNVVAAPERRPSPERAGTVGRVDRSRGPLRLGTTNR